MGLQIRIGTSFVKAFTAGDFRLHGLSGLEGLRVLQANNYPVANKDVSTPLRFVAPLEPLREQHDRCVIPTNGRNLGWITF
jgi:hypothetical protein